ncbi:phage portal protein [Paracoccus sp. MC1862]|uniref:phage portal protein n=1 Tax=Paracoccus sp. MC1862 TaxID=2760307 RepID=UPI0016049F6F|nr:phage portal protein [Paracoccus sp. MC1862]MBB1498473.1 phage portal protein [Paracoccus sp. MC1862]QQO43825.1 phage portal protein [Paracoccus sp. MC1862]
MRLWPFTRKTVPAEQKSLASPDAALMAALGILDVTSTGIVVSPSEALRVPVVANAIQLISEAVASLDVTVKRIEGEDEIDVPDHPLLALLRDEANDWTSGFELIRQIVRDALISDAGGMAWVNRIGGEAREIIRYRNGVLQFETDVETGERRYRTVNRVIPARDVIHLLPPHDRAPLTLAREAIGIAVALDRHAASLFSRGARPSGALVIPKGMGEEAIKAARAGWRAAHEGTDQGRTAFLYDGMSFEPFTFNSTDAQFLENRKFQIAEIARAFNIPSPMLGDLERATWSNSEQKGREFLSYTLEPWLRALEGAMRRALFSDDERRDHVIRFDRDDLTRADLATRATTINSLIASRTINPNEGRSWLGLPPRAGGDEFLNPNISAAPEAPPASEADDAAE